MSVAHALIRAAFKDREDLVNLSALARKVGVSPQRFNGYWHGRHPWPADVALSVLAASGRLRRDAVGFAYEGDVPPLLAGLLGAVNGVDTPAPRQANKVSVTRRGTV